MRRLTVMLTLMAMVLGIAATVVRAENGSQDPWGGRTIRTQENGSQDPWGRRAL